MSLGAFPAYLLPGGPATADERDRGWAPPDCELVYPIRDRWSRVCASNHVEGHYYAAPELAAATQLRPLCPTCQQPLRVTFARVKHAGFRNIGHRVYDSMTAMNEWAFSNLQELSAKGLVGDVQLVMLLRRRPHADEDAQGLLVVGIRHGDTGEVVAERVGLQEPAGSLTLGGDQALDGAVLPHGQQLLGRDGLLVRALRIGPLLEAEIGAAQGQRDERRNGVPHRDGAATREVFLNLAALLLQLSQALLHGRRLRALLDLPHHLVDLREPILAVALRLLTVRELASGLRAIEVPAFRIGRHRFYVALHAHVGEAEAVERVLELGVDVDGLLERLRGFGPRLDAHVLPRGEIVRPGAFAVHRPLLRGRRLEG